MDQENLPTAFVWRGITLERVVHRERTGALSMFDMGTERFVDRPSKPPLFSGEVGIWRYTLQLQADSSWVGKIWIGGACNVGAPSFSDFVAALDFAAEWWAATVKAIPPRSTHA